MNNNNNNSNTSNPSSPNGSVVNGSPQSSVVASSNPAAVSLLDLNVSAPVETADAATSTEAFDDEVPPVSGPRGCLEALPGVDTTGTCVSELPDPGVETINKVDSRTQQGATRIKDVGQNSVVPTAEGQFNQPVTRVVPSASKDSGTSRYGNISVLKQESFQVMSGTVKSLLSKPVMTFDGRNYLQFKRTMELMFAAHVLQDFLQGTCKYPKADEFRSLETHRRATQIFSERRACALLIIQTHCDVERRLMIEHLDDPKRIMDLFAKRFQGSSQA